MIEFDVKCPSCKKLITLRVRDAQARMFFEEKGAHGDPMSGTVAHRLPHGP